MDDYGYHRRGETPPKRSNDGTALTEWGAYGEGVRNFIGFRHKQDDAILGSGDEADNDIHPALVDSDNGDHTELCSSSNDISG